MPKGAFTWEKAAGFWETAMKFFAEAEAGAFQDHPVEGARMSKEISAAAKDICGFAKDVAELESGL